MNNIIELVFIADCSHALVGKEFETVSSINKLLDKHRNTYETVYVTTVVFNGEASMLHDRLKLTTVNPLTINDLKCGGNAALYDSIGITINHIRNIHHYIRTEDVPRKTVFYIFSEGLENASVKYGRSAVRNMIEQQKKNSHWEFHFERENIYTAKKMIEKNNYPTSEYGIDDEDFKKIMEILKNGRFKL